MNYSNKSIIGATLAGALVFGTGCGGENEPELTRADHESEVLRLTIQRDLAATILDQGQVQYVAEIEALPEDCRKAVINYVPSEGAFTGVPSAEASAATSEWCGPDHLDAIPNLRREFRNLQDYRSDYEVLELAIAQHLGWLEVPVPPTTQG